MAIEPCPWCKRAHERTSGLLLVRKRRGDDDFPTHRMECACGACGPSYPGSNDAIEFWNRVASQARDLAQRDREIEIHAAESLRIATEAARRLDLIEELHRDLARKDEALRNLIQVVEQLVPEPSARGVADVVLFQARAAIQGGE